jgi:hypothetical protein
MYTLSPSIYTLRSNLSGRSYVNLRLRHLNCIDMASDKMSIGLDPILKSLKTPIASTLETSDRTT